MLTMGDIARCSLENEDLLYKIFGINAELLIDHAWGWEPCEIKHIKAYKPETNSLSVGQVLQEPYSAKKGRMIVREMTNGLVMDIVEKGLITDQVELTVGYDTVSLTPDYNGEVITDRYGRKAPKMAHGTENLGRQTSSTKLIVDAMLRLYDRIVDPDLLVRRMYVVVNHVMPPGNKNPEPEYEQLNLFTDYEAKQGAEAAEQADLEKEQRLQQAMLKIRQRYGKHSILHGTSYQEGATGRDRNQTIGGHKA